MDIITYIPTHYLFFTLSLKSSQEIKLSTHTWLELIYVVVPLSTGNILYPQYKLI